MGSTNRCYLYWIRKSTDTDIFTEGYVGITNNPQSRWKSHMYTAKTTNGNHKLYNALRSTPDAFNMHVILCSTSDYCLELEYKLRPNRNVGLNHAIGGAPTLQGTSNYVFTEDVKRKISDGVKRAYRDNNDYAERQKKCRLGIKPSLETRQLMSLSASKTDRTKWRNNVADKELWFYAETYYSLFVEDNKITPKLFAEKCNLPLGKIGALLKSFRKGWNPTEDKEYLEFKEIYHVHNPQF